MGRLRGGSAHTSESARAFYRPSALSRGQSRAEKKLRLSSNPPGRCPDMPVATTTLTESFCASIATASAKAANTSIAKDAAIFVHELQPVASQRQVFKKSATARNCLAISKSHIFAAQEGKAVVHVYSREKGSQEATIVFGEKVTSLALACDDLVLVLGTENGSIILWETATGRQVHLPQPHLQPVTSLVVSPDDSHLLSGSADASIHVWSLPSILSFSVSPNDRSPIHTLSHHRAPITSLAIGHSSTTANIAISGSQDGNVCVWDYHRNVLLRAYILDGTLYSLLLDPTDSTFYASFEDGSIQKVHFFDQPSLSNPLYNKDSDQRLVQPDAESRWRDPAQNLGASLSMTLSFDSGKLLTGHSSGKVAVWNAFTGIFETVIATLPGPVANLAILSPIGFPVDVGTSVKLHAVVKPRLETSIDQTGIIPGNYTLTAQFVGNIATPVISADSLELEKVDTFEEALTHASFPACLLDEGLAELSSWDQSQSAVPMSSNQGEADFVSLSNGPVKGMSKSGLEQQNQQLRQQIANLQRVQKVTFKQLAELREGRDKKRQGSHNENADEMYDSE